MTEDHQRIADALELARLLVKQGLQVKVQTHARLKQDAIIITLLDWPCVARIEYCSHTPETPWLHVHHPYSDMHKTMHRAFEALVIDMRSQKRACEDSFGQCWGVLKADEYHQILNSHEVDND